MTEPEHTVLLVDDDARLLRGLERQVRVAPFRILTAVSASEATAILKKHKVDLVVTDLLMPGMSGTEFLEYLRDHHPELIVIVLSGNVSVPFVRKIVDGMGVHQVFNKPCDARQLESAIRLALVSKGLEADAVQFPVPDLSAEVRPV